MSEQINVEHAFDPEARQAQADLNEYVASRPYEDEKGGKHDPENGQFVNSDKYFDDARESYEQDTMPEAYEDMSVTQVAKALAKAEFEGDKTKVEDLSDVLADKMSSMEDDAFSDRDVEHSGDRSDNLWDRVMGVKDAELAKLKSESKQPEKNSKTSDPENVEDVEKVDQVEARRKRLHELNHAAANLDLQRVRGRAKEGDKEKLEAIDNEIKQILKDQYETEDEDDPRIKAAIDFLEQEQSRLTDAARELEEAEDNSKQSKGGLLRPVREGELDEGKENPPAGLGAIESWTFDEVPKEKWTTDEPDDVEPPKDEIPEEEPPKDPTTEQPPVEVPPRTPETPDRVRGPRRLRKFGRACLALLALGPVGYVAGRLHENYIVKSYDTPSVDTINKFEDKTRGVSEENQEHMVRNFDLTEKFLDAETGIGTKEGAANFKAMQKAVDTEVARLQKVHPKWTEQEARDAAERNVKSRLTAWDAKSTVVKINNNHK